MKNRTTPKFLRRYGELPAEVRDLADASFALYRANPRHPSIGLKKVGRFWSARIGLHYRAIAVEDGADLLWFWIGTHAEYDGLVG